MSPERPGDAPAKVGSESAAAPSSPRAVGAPSAAAGLAEAAAPAPPEPEACEPGAPARCGGHGASGPPGTLHACEGGVRVPVERCRVCQPMPLGRDDRCAPDAPPPPRLVRALSPRPYVEGDCAPASHPGLEGPVLRCRYAALGLSAEVVVQNPDADRVARWIADAASYVPALDGLRAQDPAGFERGLLAMAAFVRHQSSRVFPLRGEIVEDLGSGPRAFAFDRGVVTPCGDTCRCRIDSLTPAMLCRYRADVHGIDERACLVELSGRAGDEAWRAQCVDNHASAQRADFNEHFRARAHWAASRVARACSGRAAPCPAGIVVAAVEDAYRSR